MTPIHLLAFEPGSGALRSHPLPLDGPGSSCTLRLRSLPGSSGIHLALENGHGVLLRAEVASEGNEWVEVEIGLEGEEHLSLSSAGRRIVYLPPGTDNEPVPPLRPAYKARQLDVALLVDGTTCAGGVGAAQTPAAELPPPPLLLADRERWSRHAESLVATVETLATETKADLRVAVIAFGDRPIAEASAPDLRPAYHLYPARPEERILRRESSDQLRSRLLSLPGSSGGDFVDSLADALAACRELRWRQAARKLVLLLGDSPGYSILRPSPREADVQVRERDVDVEAAALHRDEVEILTLYHAPKLDAVTYRLVGEFIDHARAQYQRIAARPELTFETASFDPAAAVAALRSRVLVIGRGASPGILGRTGTARS
jgi:hypothetical protein